MALFGKKEEQKKSDAPARNTGAQPTIAERPLGGRPLSEVLVRPRITEKATDLTEGGVYAFEVATWANKQEVKEAVQHFYKVTPIHVRMVRVPAKSVFSRRGKRGIRSVGKKAYVHLKAGESIQIA